MGQSSLCNVAVFLPLCINTYQRGGSGPIPTHLAKASLPAAEESPVTQRNKNTINN